MSVNKGDRRESKVEFDNTYFKVYDDCVRLIECNFGAKGDIKEKKQGYIRAMSDRILKSVCDMGTYILKDCNACCRSIHEMDKLFERLFLKHESYRKVTREQLIRKAYREAYNGKGIFRRRNCYRGDFEHEHF